MTLYIKVTDIERLANQGVLVVEGSKAGLLSSYKISSNQKFNPPFLIKCASDDILNFKVSQDLKDYQSGHYFAQGVLHGLILTKKYRSELLGNPSASYDENANQNAVYFQTSNNEPHKVTSPLIGSVLQHQIQLHDQNQQSAGIIKCTINFDQVSHFEGELCAAGQKHASVVKSGDKKELYKGKCKTKNLFSILDPSCKDQEMKVIESIYKDGDQVVM